MVLTAIKDKLSAPDASTYYTVCKESNGFPPQIILEVLEVLRWIIIVKHKAGYT